MEKFQPVPSPSDGAHAPEEKRVEKKRSGEWRSYLKTALASAIVLFQQSSIEPEPPATTYAERHIAATELEMYGTTSERSQARTVLSERLERGLSPFKYSVEDGQTGKVEMFIADSGRFLTALVEGAEDVNEERRDSLVAEIIEKFTLSEPLADAFFEARMDAFRLYLGLPQEQETFGISEFSPEASADDMFYYSINDFAERYAAVNGRKQTDPKTNEVIIEPLSERDALRHMYFIATDVGKYNAEFEQYDLIGVMGRYTLTRGEDENGVFVSYYDRWDLGGSIEGTGGGIGKPYEIYDRLYIEDPTIIEEPKLVVHLREDVTGD